MVIKGVLGMETNGQTPAPHKQSFSIDYRVIIVVLLLAVVGLGILSWKYRSDSTANSDRTIQVTGEAKITAEPDEFVFYPSYEVKNGEKKAAIETLSKKSEEIVGRLKALGIPDNKIKADTSGYDSFYYYDGQQQIYTLRFTITVGSRADAQKVQDYLVTTAPSGNVLPQATFSAAKRKELESKARDEATKEARSKADQSAKNLGFKVGRVKAVTDGSGFGDIIPLRAVAEDKALSTSAQLSVQPGQNDLNYSVTVIYFVK